MPIDNAKVDATKQALDARLKQPKIDLRQICQNVVKAQVTAQPQLTLEAEKLQPIFDDLLLTIIDAPVISSIQKITTHPNFALLSLHVKIFLLELPLKLKDFAVNLRDVKPDYHAHIPQAVAKLLATEQAIADFIKQDEELTKEIAAIRKQLEAPTKKESEDPNAATQNEKLAKNLEDFTTRQTLLRKKYRDQLGEDRFAYLVEFANEKNDPLRRLALFACFKNTVDPTLETTPQSATLDNLANLVITETIQLFLQFGKISAPESNSPPKSVSPNSVKPKSWLDKILDNVIYTGNNLPNPKTLESKTSTPKLEPKEDKEPKAIPAVTVNSYQAVMHQVFVNVVTDGYNNPNSQTKSLSAKVTTQHLEGLKAPIVAEIIRENQKASQSPTNTVTTGDRLVEYILLNNPPYAPFKPANAWAQAFVTRLNQAFIEKTSELLLFETEQIVINLVSSSQPDPYPTALVRFANLLVVNLVLSTDNNYQNELAAQHRTQLKLSATEQLQIALQSRAPTTSIAAKTTDTHKETKSTSATTDLEKIYQELVASWIATYDESAKNSALPYAQKEVRATQLQALTEIQQLRTAQTNSEEELVFQANLNTTLKALTMPNFMTTPIPPGQPQIEEIIRNMQKTVLGIGENILHTKFLQLKETVFEQLCATLSMRCPLVPEFMHGRNSLLQQSNVTDAQLSAFDRDAQAILGMETFVAFFTPAPSALSRLNSILALPYCKEVALDAILFEELDTQARKTFPFTANTEAKFDAVIFCHKTICSFITDSLTSTPTLCDHLPTTPVANTLKTFQSNITVDNDSKLDLQHEVTQTIQQAHVLSLSSAFIEKLDLVFDNAWERFLLTDLGKELENFLLTRMAILRIPNSTRELTAFDSQQKINLQNEKFNLFLSLARQPCLQKRLELVVNFQNDDTVKDILSGVVTQLGHNLFSSYTQTASKAARLDTAAQAAASYNLRTQSTSTHALLARHAQRQTRQCVIPQLSTDWYQELFPAVLRPK